MNKMVFALVITAIATSAHTANARAADLFAFVQCGVKLGGKYLPYTASREDKNTKDLQMNHVAGAVKSEPTGFTLSEGNTVAAASEWTDSPNSLEFRLPPKLTVAGVGCSWR